MKSKNGFWRTGFYLAIVAAALASATDVSAIGASAGNPMQPTACRDVCAKIIDIGATVATLQEELKRLQGELEGLTEVCHATDDPPPMWKGDISFVLTWVHEGDEDPLGPDIDIWVQDPNGNLLSSSSKSRMGPTEEGGTVDLDDEAGYAEDGDVALGAGPERVYWPNGKSPAGNYEFGCKHYEGSGTAMCTISVYIGSRRVLSVSDNVGPDKRESRTWSVENAGQNE